MKSSIIQYGLQMWEKENNYISSIYYLNEYYILTKTFLVLNQSFRSRLQDGSVCKFERGIKIGKGICFVYESETYS